MFILASSVSCGELRERESWIIDTKFEIIIVVAFSREKASQRIKRSTICYFISFFYLLHHFKTIAQVILTIEIMGQKTDNNKILEGNMLTSKHLFIFIPRKLKMFPRQIYRLTEAP